jgi:small-conductance mechanosensitive channel
MNEISQLFQDLLADLLRIEVLRQFAALGLAFGVWLVLKTRLKLENRRWPQETRWPWLALVKPLANETLLWICLAVVSSWLVATTGVGDLARYLTRFYAICLLSRFGLVVLRQYLPPKVIKATDLRVIRPLLLLIGILLFYSQFADFNQLWSTQVLHWGNDHLTFGALMMLIFGTYFVTAGAELPALVAAEVMRRAFELNGPNHRASALVIRYGLAAFGLVLILAYVGVNPTMLAAVGGGLSVGLGFGLKEVFSNFVSGLWLLLEGAVRPGDVLLLESGKGEDPCEVLELGMRATTLWRDRDNVELVVPNQTFFTQSMVTYSGLRDRRRRGQVLIGVAYRHPPETVIALLEATALTIPRVLNEPGPKGLLLRYDDSAITYAIRYWIENPMNGIGVASEVGIAVWNAFQREAIEIPFPQRVLHGAPSLPGSADGQ